MDRDILATVFKLLLAAAVLGGGGLLLGGLAGRYLLPACPPAPEFRALAVDTPTPRLTYTRYPTATPRPTYTPYPTPAPAPEASADAVEAYYRGFLTACYAADYMLYQQGLYELMADCELFTRQAWEAGQHEIELEGWVWPPGAGGPTATPQPFWDDPAGSGEASPME